MTRVHSIWIIGALVLLTQSAVVLPSEEGRYARAFVEQLNIPRTELLGERSRFTKVYQVTDELRMLQISTEPQHYQEENGNWIEINTQIGTSADPAFAFSATHNVYQVHFKEDISAPYFIRYETQGAQVQFGMDPVQPWGHLNAGVGKASGNVLLYEEIYPNASLRYELAPQQMLEEFTVSDRTLARRIQQLNKRFTVSNAEWHFTRKGAVKFTRQGSGETLFRIPRPVLYERDRPGVRSYAVHFEIRQDAESYQLIKVVEPAGQAWLSAPERTFPVVIDDSIALNRQNGAGRAGSVTKTKSDFRRATNRTRIVIGRVVSQEAKFRGFMEWDTDAIPQSATIQSVGVYMYVQSGYGMSNTVDIVKLASPLATYSDTSDGNKQLYRALKKAPPYDLTLPNFQRSGDIVIPLGFDDYTFNTALDDLLQSVAEHKPFGIGLRGSNEKTQAVSLVGYGDTTRRKKQPALIIFYNGVKGSASPMLRPLRTSFYDGEYYWAFFRANFGQMYYGSKDGVSWTEAGRLSSSDNQHHSEWHYAPTNKVLAGYASQVEGVFTDMVVKLGTIYHDPTPAIRWTQPQTIFEATRNPTTDGYDFPTVFTDSKERCWVMARHVTLTTSAMVITRSKNGTCKSWVKPTVVLDATPNGGDSGVGGYAVPLTNGKVYAVTKNWNTLQGKLFDGNEWATTPELIDNYTAFGVYSQGMSVVAIGDVVHMVYVGGDSSLKYTSWNGSWSSPITLRGGGTFWSPSLSWDTRTNDLYLVYRKRSSTGKANGRALYLKGTPPYRPENWGAPLTITEHTYAPHTIFGAFSPGAVSPWAATTNYSGDGVNFTFYVNGAYGVDFFAMQEPAP